MTPEQIKTILADHALWASGKGGKRADLQRAYLQGAYLQGADLQGADLQGAYLQGADLQGAYLQGAYLQGAYLQGAKLSLDCTASALLARVIRNDGYQFELWATDKGPMIRAGCQFKTPAEYRVHVTTYTDQAKRDETSAILTFFDTRIEQEERKS